MKVISRTLAIFFLSMGIAHGDPVFEIEKIAGKSEKEVAAALGKPTKKETSKYGPRCFYHGEEVEIVFIGGKADWITVNNLKDIKYDESAIEALGLKPRTTTFKNQFSIRWEPYGSYRSISIFPLGDKVDYAYVQVVTR